MASNAVPLSSTPVQLAVEVGQEEERRPQAGPLPRKRGEIGFDERIHTQEVVPQETHVELPARHPADRDGGDQQNNTNSSTSPPLANSSTSTTGSTVPVAVVDASQIINNAATAVPPSSASQKKQKHAIYRFYHRLAKVSFGGISLVTHARFILQLFILGASIAMWIVVVKRLDAQSASRSTNNDTADVSFGASGSIFVHVAFGVGILGQLLFLERCIYLMRAQRYNHTHPDSGLPFHGRRLIPQGPRQVNVPFAPWNRPPLPTYAAALAQSGHGTGDVEDNAIAIPPPPAYGNTRGSTLLLAGFMRESLRRGLSDERASTRERRTSDHSSRPVSYMSRDEQWEERCDAERALYLAETLARLEEGNSTASQTRLATTTNASLALSTQSPSASSSSVTVTHSSRDS